MKVTVEHDGKVEEFFCDTVLTGAVNGGTGYQCEWRNDKGLATSHVLALILVMHHQLFDQVGSPGSGDD